MLVQSRDELKVQLIQQGKCLLEKVVSIQFFMLSFLPFYTITIVILIMQLINSRIRRWLTNC